MTKDILAVLGIDGVIGTIVYAIEPSFLKWVLLGGLASLLGLFYFTKQGRVSIYGTQIVMAIIMSIHFA
ncbi:hypothetical protein KKC87_04050 [Patescibacteria group bacterium]|nr:hypothetical protein [Patescibacteria group bacterium]